MEFLITFGSQMSGWVRTSASSKWSELIKSIWWLQRSLAWITRPALGKSCGALDSHCFCRTWRRTFFSINICLLPSVVIYAKNIIAVLFCKSQWFDRLEGCSFHPLCYLFSSLSEEIIWERCWEFNLMTTSGSVSPLAGWGLASCTSCFNKEPILWEGGNATSQLVLLKILQCWF